MAWHDVMQQLEAKLEGTRQGTYRPLDNVPFFRVQYPPSEEREALRQFDQLALRLRQRGWEVKCLSLTEMCRKAVEQLLNGSSSDLVERLKELEQNRERSELRERLSEYLPNQLADVLIQELRDLRREDVAILLRMGALYPFIRSSSLGSRLEGRVQCIVVLPYPGTTTGALLDAAPADPHGGYYRGEIIAWR